MGNNRPVKTKNWVRFLIAHNCKYLRTKASHDHYKCPNCWRTITHREKNIEKKTKKFLLYIYELTLKL